MNENNLASIRMIIYHNSDKQPILTCKPDYLGFMGIFLKGIHLGYPVGTSLEIEFQTHKNDTKGQRVSMIVNNAEDNGTGLRLKSFDKDVIIKWKNVLRNIFRFVKIKS